MRPIYSYLKNRKDIVDFKFPGHKKRFNFEDINKIDETETIGTDNLHDPQGIIKESLDFAREVYGTKKTFYMVNGSTGGIHAAILSQTMPGDEILIQRNSHMSVYHALILARLRADYLYPEQVEDFLPYLDIEKAKKVIDQSKAKLLVLTNPTYEGYGSNIKEIIDLAHAKNMLVIVDEAHGSHLYFTDRLIPSALDEGADIVIHSAHKTLPSLTQTSLVHVNSDRVDLERLEQFSRILQTSSPSYVFMASLEKAISYMAKEGRENLDRLVDHCQGFYKSLEKFDNISLAQAGSYYAKDITRLHFGLKAFSGQELSDILYNKYSINVEMASLKYLVGVASLMNRKEDFSLLLRALEDLNRSRIKRNAEIPRVDFCKADKLMEIYEAFYMPSETMDIEDSLGRVSASYLIPYPPGTVILAPGERVQEDHIEIYKTYKEKSLNILDQGKIRLVREDSFV